ncbi:19834_t:CDS:1, partial [Rhizophagus irregularis]
LPAHKVAITSLIIASTCSPSPERGRQSPLSLALRKMVRHTSILDKNGGPEEG